MILTAEGLGKRFRQRWALADGTVQIPAGGSSASSAPTARARRPC